MGHGARVLRPDRAQLKWDMVDLDSQLAPDHLARDVVSFVDGLDLSPLYARIKARDDVAGRPTSDPGMVLALWLYATLDGVGSARYLAALCDSHVAYRWICGGVPVNYHGLADFRAGLDAEFLDVLLTDSVVGLAASGVVDLEEALAIDGTKLRANAGYGSYRSEAGLAAFEAAAADHVARLRSELEADPAASRRRREAALEAKTAERAARLDRAQARMRDLKAERAARAKSHKKDETGKPERKVSTTDPDARLMRMADGAVRPAWNMMVAAFPESQVICAISATDRRNEAGLASQMVDRFAARYGFRPTQLLVDGRMATRADITELAAHDPPVTVYAPLPKEMPEAELKPSSRAARASKRKRESAAVKAWRARMAGAEGKEVYKRRKLIELVNAQLKNSGWHKTVLRGRAKVEIEARLHALAHNLKRGLALRRQANPAPA